jgi:hypothetical protein
LTDFKTTKMKHANTLFILLLAGLIVISCKKDEVKTTPLASLTMVNTVNGGAAVRLGSNLTSVANNGSAQLALVAGENNLYVWPTGDSAHPYYTAPKFNAEDRGVYSLFLTGTSAAPEGLMVKETIPYRTDSTAGIRFINLAPNTANKALNITLSTTTTTNEVANLAFKQYTDFKTYPGLYNSTYTFQVRNDTSAAPKAPLATFALAASVVPRFANITLVIRQNGTSGIGVFRVNNDR